MELKLTSSSNDVFVYPTTAHEDPASAPDPTTVVTQCFATSSTISSLVILNISLRVPEKHKSSEKIKDLTIVVEASETLAVSALSGVQLGSRPLLILVYLLLLWLPVSKWISRDQ